jgi:hypothetical protein
MSAYPHKTQHHHPRQKKLSFAFYRPGQPAPRRLMVGRIGVTA